MSQSSNSTHIARCPRNEVLSQLVSGSLAEVYADKLFRHIDQCSQCQDAVDRISQEADGLIAAARRSDSDSSRSQGDNLPELIENAKQIHKQPSGFTLNPRFSVPANRPRVNLDGFVKGLKRSGLFEEAEVTEFLGDINTEDSGQLAKALIDRGKLTTFQAKSLLRGRWKGFVLGNYVILDKLGQGGMGSVFKARHRRMGRTVCLKVMNPSGRKSPELMQRFRQEARTVGALKHPNIVVAHDADEANGVPFLVMEYIRGSDVARQVSKGGPLSVGQALLLVTQAAQALAYAHSRGVVHRDIKPHNLLLSAADESSGSVSSVKILDMGLARFDSFMSDNPDASVHAAMTNTGIIMGTVDYMSPEQAICTRDADARSDVYSLGCTLHYVLTGRPVYEGDTIMARLIAHREQPIPSLRAAREDVPEGLDAVFRRMIAKKPDDRYQSMDELLSDLQLLGRGLAPERAMAAAAADALVVDPPESPAELTQRRARETQRSLRTWITGLALAALVTVALVQLGDGTQIPGLGPAETGWPGNRSGPTEEVRSVIGHPATVRNGGRGRALLMIPNGKNSHFHDDQFLAIKEALQRRGIDYAVMGTTDRPASPKHHLIRDVQPDLSIEDFDPQDFDAIFIIEGSVHEFTHKNKARHDSVKSVFGRTLDEDLVVSTFCDSCWVVRDSGYISNMKYRKQGNVHVGTRDNQPGAFVKIERKQDIDDAVNVAFALIRKRLQKLEQDIEAFGRAEAWSK